MCCQHCGTDIYCLYHWGPTYICHENQCKQKKILDPAENITMALNPETDGNNAENLTITFNKTADPVEIITQISEGLDLHKSDSPIMNSPSMILVIFVILMAWLG